jgi:hypothetical protein
MTVSVTEASAINVVLRAVLDIPAPDGSTSSDADLARRAWCSPRPPTSGSVLASALTKSGSSPMGDTPKRIQLRRTKGWRKPDGAIVVARRTLWGNPFTIPSAVATGFISADWSDADKRAFVTDCFRDWLQYGPDSSWWFEAGRHQWQWIREHLPELRGHDLACWCPLDQPCHADVLLTEATRG